MSPRPWRDVFRDALAGVAYGFRSQRNLWVHVTATAAALALALALRLAAVEVALILFVSAVVLAAELLNTAIERAVDLAAGEGPSPLARAAKDAAAGGVLIAALGAVAVAGALFLPRLVAALGPGGRGGWTVLLMMAGAVLVTCLAGVLARRERVSRRAAAWVAALGLLGGVIGIGLALWGGR